MPINALSSGDAESEVDFMVLVEAAVELVRARAMPSGDYPMFMILFAVEFRTACGAMSNEDVVALAGPNADLVAGIMTNVVKKTRSRERSARVFHLMADRFDELADKLARPRSRPGVPGDTPTNPRSKT